MHISGVYASDETQDQPDHENIDLYRDISWSVINTKITLPLDLMIPCETSEEKECSSQGA